MGAPDGLAGRDGPPVRIRRQEGSTDNPTSEAGDRPPGDAARALL